MKYYPEERGIPAPKPIYAAGIVRVKIVPTGERPTLPQAPEDYRPLHAHSPDPGMRCSYMDTWAFTPRSVPTGHPEETRGKAVLVGRTV